MKKLITLTALLMLSSSLFAQEVQYDVQMRYRSEFAKNVASFQNTAFTNTIAGNGFNLLRSRLGVSFTGSNNVSAFFQFQDARSFGEETSTMDASAGSFDLHQGFIHVDNLIRDGMSLKVGRTEIALGNERLVGAGDWSNTGRVFDGGLLKKADDKFSYSVFAVRVDENTPTRDFDPDEDFYGFFGSYRNSEKRTFNGFAFLNYNNDKLTVGTDKNKSKLFRITTGFDYNASVSFFDYEVEAAYQYGNQMKGLTTKRDNIGAYMLGLRFKYNIQHEKNSFVGLGFDLLSGDDDATDDEFNAFNTLYATNHKYYGYMDYFTDIPAATSNLGLRDIILRVGTTTRDKITVMAEWHYFSTDKKNASDHTCLGNELDLTIKYNYREDLGIQLGCSVFMPGDIPKETPDNDTKGIWSYAMLTYNFNN